MTKSNSCLQCFVKRLKKVRISEKTRVDLLKLLDSRSLDGFYFVEYRSQEQSNGLRKYFSSEKVLVGELQKVTLSKKFYRKLSREDYSEAAKVHNRRVQETHTGLIFQKSCAKYFDVTEAFCKCCSAWQK